MNITELREMQRSYYHTGATLPVSFRRRMLLKLLQSIKNEELALIQALKEDLGKSEFEAYSNEIGFIYHEIRHTLRKLKSWAKPTRVVPELYLLPGSARVIKEPLGSVLIIAPWNYPMHLLFAPLIAAIAAGNTVVLKPSELAPHTAEVNERLISATFDPQFIAVVQGGPETSTALIDQKFDHLFFTGSVPVGRIVMERAARHLTPVTLELGGKSPAIVDASADLTLAARKIAWGKFNNAGQTCIAPDYVLVDASVEQAFLEKLGECIRDFYGDQPLESPAYGRIINEKHFGRLEKLIKSSPVFLGGHSDASQRYIAPTVMHPVTWDDEVMEDEIFGPLLPVLSFNGIEDCIGKIRQRERPLAVYIFARSTAVQDALTTRLSFGGGGINCTVLQVASSKLPFGGIGASGMGCYHGQAGFDTFSHAKSILKQPAKFDLKLAYPHKPVSLKLLKKILG